MRENESTHSLEQTSRSMVKMNMHQEGQEHPLSMNKERNGYVSMVNMDGDESPHILGKKRETAVSTADTDEGSQRHALPAGPKTMAV